MWEQDSCAIVASLPFPLSLPLSFPFRCNRRVLFCLVSLLHYNCHLVFHESVALSQCTIKAYVNTHTHAHTLERILITQATATTTTNYLHLQLYLYLYLSRWPQINDNLTQLEPRLETETETWVELSWVERSPWQSMRNYLLGIEIVVRGAALVKIKDSRWGEKKNENTTQYET